MMFRRVWDCNDDFGKALFDFQATGYRTIVMGDHA
jgi:hypothetical protein